ncbi:MULTISPECIES: MurR/RpiR family transcriptional regulator [Lachnoanaerobaculum]|uniref:SIS domain protein n=2 Tax=Lachnoanaerobaculum TaxID=1164882 RepID=A0A133ZLU4_9FIRM|nr:MULTISPECIES: MurR/RpiR family transcriptional regulator [Lachnoanaerobaculum]MBS6727961.1 MurR/RpiR family transcriptional regulator [Lachnospiraceae bacterium oral taxon 082]MDU5596329.1 MurR/RpiR family transcriptional regulator [Lachnospiraceae bacterium]KXB56392.1 SIS domain protein [Lachnoanaerobaculum saburreum]MBS6931349.1 MurR/RpiR family transcriptional regulator [Lachnospiraceae bacterium oral taxon 082]RRJ16325.1 MurR/RpiR family transcriptional regulator [Lachnoanaerobaculum or
MDIVLRIKEEYRKLTKSEKKVADYFIENYKDAINESTQSIAVATDTSPATVIRFVKTLKFDGLQQLKLAIAADMDSQKPDITDEIIHQKDGLSEIVEKNKRNLINSIERLYALMDLELIEKSVDAIDSAKKVYLFGVGASGIVCYDINYKLSRIGKDVVFNNDIHLQLVNLNFITKEDACVCVSYSGNTKETVLVAEIAKKAGAKTVGICCYGRNELSKICDITLRVPHDERELRLGAISSRNTTLTLLDTIYLAITHRHYPDVLNDIESTRDLIKKLRD